MKTYLNNKGHVLRSEKDMPFTIIEIAQTLITLIPKIIGLFGKKIKVPKFIDKIGDDFSDRYYLTMTWNDNGVSIGYVSDIDYLKPLIMIDGTDEKDAKKTLHSELIKKGYII